jgi:hypothetical protein
MGEAGDVKYTVKDAIRGYGWGHSVVEHLFSMHEVLGSSPD